MTNHLANLFLIWVSSLMSLLRLATIILKSDDERITTAAGDLILYQGDKFVIYYDTNSWNFTRLGKIKNISETELKNILGENNVTVTLTLNPSK